MEDPDNDVELFYLRPLDIAVYVGRGTIDVGITGHDLLVNSGTDAEEHMQLGFGASTFRFAAPNDSPITKLEDIEGKRVATTFDKLVHDYLVEHGINAETVHLDGAVESSVQLGVADLIADVVSTGTTLRNAGLRIFAEPLMHSEAVLIRSPRLEADDERLTILSRRLQGVLTAQRNVLMDYDIPVEKVSAAVDITPGFESPTISPLHDKQWAAVRVVVPKAKVNQLMDQLYEVGARGMSKLIIKKQYSPEPRDIYFTVPNFISLLRIISIPFIAMLVSHHRMVTALVVLALSAISDGLDGMIARSFNQVSKIGQILDPIADRLLIFCSILALGVANIIPWWMLIVVGLRDLIMAVLILVLAQHDYGPLPVHFVGKAGTAMLLIAIVALIFADIWSNSAADTLHLCGLATGIWGVGLYWLAGYIYMRQGIQLLKNDTNSKD